MPWRSLSRSRSDAGTAARSVRSRRRAAAYGKRCYLAITGRWRSAQDFPCWIALDGRFTAANLKPVFARPGHHRPFPGQSNEDQGAKLIQTFADGSKLGFRMCFRLSRTIQNEVQRASVNAGVGLLSSCCRVGFCRKFAHFLHQKPDGELRCLLTPPNAPAN